jgi:hypothetical protein
MYIFFFVCILCRSPHVPSDGALSAILRRTSASAVFADEALLPALERLLPETGGLFPGDELRSIE